jgi:hypothetical protein
MSTFKRLSDSLGISQSISNLISNTQSGIDSIAEVYDALYALNVENDLKISELEYQLIGLSSSYSNGTSGTSGINGANGSSGTSGIDGANGADGTSGTSGVDGTSGTSGVDGVNGADGTSGVDGTNGVDGTSGTSGVDGVNGADGTSGVDGANGSSGTSGVDGTNGVDGTSGVDGANGTSGTSGVDGVNGADGTSGTSGVDGVNGSSGTSGVNGATGPAGSSFIPALSPSEIFRGQTHRNNSTTIDTYGGVVTSTSASNLAQSVGTASFVARQIRLRYYASIVQTGRYTGVRGSSQLFWSVTGGFRFVCNFNISDAAYDSGAQQFYGMGAYNTDLNYAGTSVLAINPITNIIGVGNETGDTNLQVFHNDGSGTASKVDLGSGFPANRTAGAASTTVYSIQLYNEPGSSSVLYEVINQETGAVAQGTLTNNLPDSTRLLNFFASRAMGSGGGVTNAGQFDLMKLGVYSIV